MENKRIEVTSTVDATVVMNVPELLIRRVWPRKGAKLSIKFSELSEAIYNPGVENLFRSGALYIEDMDIKIALGLEPEGAEKPQNIIVLTPAQQTRYLKVAPIHELKTALEKLSTDQVRELAYTAIEIKITDMAKADLLKEHSGIDVVQAIRLSAED